MPTMEQIGPYSPWIVMAVNGLIAGWIAGLLLGGGGLIRSLIVGVIGSFIGGALLKAGWLDLSKFPIRTGSDFGDQIVISTIGAVIVIVIARFLGGR